MSVSGVCRGGQGNKSEQSRVMRFSWSAAVINTMLGSNTGHTFGSGGLGKHSHLLSIFPSFLFSEPSFIFKTFFQSCFYFCHWLCLMSFLSSLLFSCLSSWHIVMEYHMLHWFFVSSSSFSLYHVFYHVILSSNLPSLSFPSFLHYCSCFYFLLDITSFMSSIYVFPHISSLPCFPFFPFVYFFFPSFFLCLKTSPCPFSSLRDTGLFLPLCVCVWKCMCVQTQQCPVQPQLLNI